MPLVPNELKLASAYQSIINHSRRRICPCLYPAYCCSLCSCPAAGGRKCYIHRGFHIVLRDLSISLYGCDQCLLSYCAFIVIFKLSRSSCGLKLALIHSRQSRYCQLDSLVLVLFNITLITTLILIRRRWFVTFEEVVLIIIPMVLSW